MQTRALHELQLDITPGKRLHNAPSVKVNFSAGRSASSIVITPPIRLPTVLPKPAHVGETPSVQSTRPVMPSPVAEQPDQSARRAHFRPNDRQISEGWYETKSQRKPHDSTNKSSLPRSKEGWINNSNSGLLNHVRRSLKDQGWTEGQGAGPRHSGISDPILPENL